jgi:hypothetical protein
MPNNTVSEATNLLLSAGLPQTVSGLLSNTDEVDYYRFTTTAASDLKLALTGLTGDARLSVFQSNGTTPLTPGSAPGNTVSTNNSGLLSESFVFNNLAAGTYIIRVDRETPVNPTAEYSYRLDALASRDAVSNSLLFQNVPLTPEQPTSISWVLNGPSLTGQVTPSIATNPEFAGLTYVSAGYFDNDRSQDILWKKDLGNGTFQLFTWFMNADGSLRESKGISLSNDATNAPVAVGNNFLIKAVEDFDGDGTSDILFDAGGVVGGITVIWRMQGSQVDLNFSNGFQSGEFTVVATGDFDASGTRDVLLRLGGTLVTWLLKDDNNKFELIVGSEGQINTPAQSGVTRLQSGALITNLGQEWELVSVGDFNKAGLGTNALADDKDDLLWVNRQSGVVVSWVMDGSVIRDGLAFFNGASVGGNAGGFNLVGVSDFDGDQNVDLLWRSKNSTSLVVWLVDGLQVKLVESGFLQVNGAPVDNLGANFQIVTRNNLLGQRQLVDYDANGRSDILFRDANSGSFILWSMNGKTVDLSKTDFVRNIDNSIPSVPASFQILGGLTSQLTRKPEGESTAGIDFSTAFNVGVLNTGPLTDATKTANYQDSVRRVGTSADYYKFKLERSSDISLRLLTARGATTLANATFDLIRDDVARTEVALTAAQKAAPITLDPGSYFIRVRSNGAIGVNVAYNLSIAGEPNVVNFKSLSVGDVTPIAANGAVRLANLPQSGPGPRTPVQIAYTLTNTEQRTSGEVRVQFYLSRTQVINPTNTQNTFSLGTQTVTSVPGNNAVKNEVFQAQLPAADDLFWTTDGDYYIGYVIDPQDLVQETFEIANPGSTDNVSVVKTVRIENTQTPDLRGESLSASAGTITRGGTINLNYTVGNIGKKGTAGLPGANNLLVRFYLYRPSTDPNLTPEQQNALDPSDSTRTVALNPFNDGEDLLPVSIPGSSVTQSQSIQLSLPNANSSFWTGAAAGTPYFIGMVTESGNVIAESLEGSALDGGNNFNRGTGLDRVAVTLAS